MGFQPKGYCYPTTTRDWKLAGRAEGTCVVSAYELRDGTRIWIITEADRSVTRS